MKKYLKKIFTLKNIFFVLSIFLLCLIFMQFYVVYTPDSGQYYYLSLIIKGTIPFTSWITVRGPSFPALIALFTTIFGDTAIGLRIGLCIIYVLTIFAGYKILNIFLSQNKNRLEKSIIYGLYLILVVFNPIIFSYSHTLLTEAIMPLVIMTSILVGYRYSHINFKNNKLKYILYTLYFVFIFIFVWFLKQPYIFVIFSTLFFNFFLEWLSNKNKYNFIQKIISVVVCVFVLIVAVKSWNQYLSNYDFDVSINNSSSTEGLISSTILRSINNNYRKYNKKCDYLDESINKYITNDKFLSNHDKEKILEMLNNDECENFELFSVLNFKDEKIDTIVIYTDGSVTTPQAINFYFTNSFKRPLLTIDSFQRNYFSTLDLYRRDVNKYYVHPGFDVQKYNEGKWLYQNEIRDYGLYVFENKRDNCWWGKAKTSEYNVEGLPYIKYMEKLEEESILSDGFSNFSTKIGVLYIVLFILIYLVLPVPLIVSFIKYIKSKYNNKYYFITMLLTTSYTNLIMHVLMGTIIDRYVYLGIPLILIGYIMFILRTKEYNISVK